MQTLAILSAILAVGTAATMAAAESSGKPSGPLDFTLTGNDGKPYPLAQHRGKVVLIVNVASKCGLTPQYAALQALYAAKKDAGLVVIGVPANDFNGQEPGTDAEIAQFCSSRYNVTFPLMSKVSVKGPAMDPLYVWLTEQSPFPGPIAWNFGKWLVGRDGAVRARFEPKVTPEDAGLLQAIDAALAATAPN
jgi:glutathione peroxidase